MSLGAVLRRTVADAPGCVASACVDLRSAKLIEVETKQAGRPELAEIAIVATDLLDPRNMAILSLYQWTGGGGTLLQHSPVQEVMFRVPPWLHVFLRWPGDAERALVVTFDDDVQVGAALTEARFALRASVRAVGER